MTLTFERLHLIRDIIGPNASLHVQVVAKDYEGILADAKKFVNWHRKISILRFR